MPMATRLSRPRRPSRSTTPTAAGKSRRASGSNSKTIRSSPSGRNPAAAFFASIFPAREDRGAVARRISRRNYFSLLNPGKSEIFSRQENIYTSPAVVALPSFRVKTHGGHLSGHWQIGFWGRVWFVHLKNHAKVSFRPINLFDGEPVGSH